MTERGGPTTESGIHFQNQVAALYLGRLLDPRQRPAYDSVIKVRVEAPLPITVDDIVIHFADGHSEYIQVKETVAQGGDAWDKLWKDFAIQRTSNDFTEADRLVLMLGSHHPWEATLRALCERATGSDDEEEWHLRLGGKHRRFRDSLEPILVSHLQGRSLFSLFACCKVVIWDPERIQVDLVPNFMPPSNTVPLQLYGTLLRKVSQHARIRKAFTREELLRDLSQEGIEMLGYEEGIEETRYDDEETRLLSERLKGLYERRKLTTAGDDTRELEREILEVQQLLRKGPQLRAGKFLGEGRYELIDLLGQGGFGTVWKAWDTEDKGHVALKVLRGEYSEDRSKRERFFLGARTMAELSHPHIVRVLECKLEEGHRHFFVMEFLPGGNFEQAVREGRLDLEERLRIVAEVGDALTTAHSAGVVHRDVKPSNILLDADGRAKLTDFDLAHRDDTVALTQTGEMIGTLQFAAPEVLASTRSVSVTSDVYSIGSVVVFALQGRDLPSSYYRRPEAAIRDLKCNGRTKEVLRRATALDCDLRYQSASEFLSEFDCATKDDPAHERPDSLKEGVRKLLDEVGGEVISRRLRRAVLNVLAMFEENLQLGVPLEVADTIWSYLEGLAVCLRKMQSIQQREARTIDSDYWHRWIDRSGEEIREWCFFADKLISERRPGSFAASSPLAFRNGKTSDDLFLLDYVLGHFVESLHGPSLPSRRRRIVCVFDASIVEISSLPSLGVIKIPAEGSSSLPMAFHLALHEAGQFVFNEALTGRPRDLVQKFRESLPEEGRERLRGVRTHDPELLPFFLRLGDSLSDLLVFIFCFRCDYDLFLKSFGFWFAETRLVRKEHGPLYEETWADVVLRLFIVSRLRCDGNVASFNKSGIDEGQEWVVDTSIIIGKLRRSIVEAPYFLNSKAEIHLRSSVMVHSLRFAVPMMNALALLLEGFPCSTASASRDVSAIKRMLGAERPVDLSESEILHCYLAAYCEQLDETLKNSDGEFIQPPGWVRDLEENVWRKITGGE